MIRRGLACPAARSRLRQTACQNYRMKMPPGVPGRVVVMSMSTASRCKFCVAMAKVVRLRSSARTPKPIGRSDCGQPLRRGSRATALPRSIASSRPSDIGTCSNSSTIAAAFTKDSRSRTECCWSAPSPAGLPFGSPMATGSPWRDSGHALKAAAFFGAAGGRPALRPRRAATAPTRWHEVSNHDASRLLRPGWHTISY